MFELVMVFQSVSTSVDGVTNPSTCKAGLEAGLHKAAKALFQTTEPLKSKLYTATKSMQHNHQHQHEYPARNLAFRYLERTAV